MQLAQAAAQVRRVGSPNARRETVRILTDARRRVYRVLAEDGDVPVDDEADASLA